MKRKSKLLLTPHKQDKRQWWYEECAGIAVIHECQDCERIENLKTIPWRAIRAALARKDGK